MNTTCVCCGQPFDNLSMLMTHIASNHTADEVMQAVAAEEKTTEKA